MHLSNKWRSQNWFGLHHGCSKSFCYFFTKFCISVCLSIRDFCIISFSHKIPCFLLTKQKKFLCYFHLENEPPFLNFRTENRNKSNKIRLRLDLDANFIFTRILFLVWVYCFPRDFIFRFITTWWWWNARNGSEWNKALFSLYPLKCCRSCTFFTTGHKPHLWRRDRFFFKISTKTRRLLVTHLKII